jgi:pimeloyl-ACP methyl ester carboxylesterase
MSDSTKHRIWTVVLDTNHNSTNSDRPTLVMTHGFGSATCHFVLLINSLIQHFRIVLFDNLSFGMNPRDG